MTKDNFLKSIWGFIEGVSMGVMLLSILFIAYQMRGVATSEDFRKLGEEIKAMSVSIEALSADIKGMNDDLKLAIPILQKRTDLPAGDESEYQRWLKAGQDASHRRLLRDYDEQKRAEFAKLKAQRQAGK